MLCHLHRVSVMTTQRDRAADHAHVEDPLRPVAAPLERRDGLFEEHQALREIALHIQRAAGRRGRLREEILVPERARELERALIVRERRQRRATICMAPAYPELHAAEPAPV